MASATMARWRSTASHKTEQFSIVLEGKNKGEKICQSVVLHKIGRSSIADIASAPDKDGVMQ